jgi:hypothetical protein
VLLTPAVCYGVDCGGLEEARERQALALRPIDPALGLSAKDLSLEIDGRQLLLKQQKPP